MSQALILKQGDQKPEVELQLLQADGNGGTTPVDLSGADVKLYVVNPTTNELLIDGASVSVVDAANGEIKYQWTSGDTDENGRWLGEVVASFSDGDLTFPNTGFLDVLINPDAQGGL